MAVKIGFGGLVIALIVVGILAFTYRKKLKAANEKVAAFEGAETE